MRQNRKISFVDITAVYEHSLKLCAPGAAGARLKRI